MNGIRARRQRPLPDSPAQRHDEIAATLDSLRAEGRRLERLGLEIPLARCHEETRYWSFVGAMFSLPAEPGPRAPLPCPDERD